MLTTPYARQTSRMRTIVRLFGHGVGGRPSEPIMARLGMPICHTSLLRQLNANAPKVQDRPHVRVVGIDEWTWWSFGNAYTLMQLCAIVIGWVLAALVIATFVRGKAATA